MSDEKKIAPEQLEHLRGLHARFDQLTKRLGELYFQKKLISNEFDAVDTALDELELERVAAAERLQTEFGASGTVDLKTGVFTPE